MEKLDRKKLIIQFFSGLLGGIGGIFLFGGMFSLIFGALYPILGDRYLVLFSAFFGLSGITSAAQGLWWDAALFLNGILGLALGAPVGILIVNKVKKFKGSTLGLFVGGFVIGSILNLFVYDYDPSTFNPIIQIILLLLIPPIAGTLGFYYKHLISVIKKQF